MLDLSNLNPEEKTEALDLLKRLGFKVSDVKQKKEKKAKIKPQPYINKYEKTCTTCNSITYEYFHMMLSDSEDFLYSKPIAEEDVDKDLQIRLYKKKLGSCQHCIEKLSKLSKEELIKMYLKEKLKWI